MIAFVLMLLLAGENWPCFRGPSRQGVSRETGIPEKWTTTENVAWKTDVPGLGWSSPIVWGDRVFLTTATDEGRSGRVILLDRRTGKVAWNAEVVQQPLRRKEKKNSFATPTPATDGQAVFAVFADGSVASLDYSGRVLWVNRDVPFYSQHGLGASPVLYRDLIIMAYDGSAAEGDLKVGWQKPWDRSFLVALDKKSGKLRWKAHRGLSRIAHVTPNIAEQGGKPVLVSAAGDVIQGFDLATGKLLWTAASQGEGVVPSVVVGDGMVYAASGFERPTIRAVRLGGSGDVTKTHIAWEQTKAVPKIPSFVYAKPYLFTIAENGIAMCLNAASGEIVWQERLEGQFSSSPVLIGGKIYALAESGETFIFRAGPKFELLARNTVDEYSQASPAVSQGTLFLRTQGKLYAIKGE